MTAHAFLLAWGAWANSATFDEPAHLATGVEYWKHGDFSIYSLSPPLLRLWAGLPAVIAGASAPGTEELQGRSIAGRHWPYADAFIEANFARFPQLLLVARLGMIPISCLSAVVTFLWARTLYGWRSGVGACALYCFNPGILANGSLVTTDVGTAAAMVIACWLWWRFCWRPTIWGWSAVLAVVTAAHLCKFTAVLLWPMLLGLAMPFWARGGWFWKGEFGRPSPRPSPGVPGEGETGGRRLYGGVLLGSWVGLGVATLILLNAVYGFRGTGEALGAFKFESATMRNVQEVLPTEFPSPLPRLLILGFDAQKRDSGIGYEGFLFGDIYRGARWYFFPVALACKSPVALIVLAGLAVWTMFVKRVRVGEWAIVLAIAVFAVGVIIFGDLNIGTRYLLPVFPLGFVLISRVWARRLRGFVPKLATGLTVIAAIECLSVAPQFLTFMNVAVGGPGNGWRVLNNSDFDWGQGLIDLRDWMRENNVTSVQLAYFGFVDPKVYGVNYTPFTAKSDARVFAVSSYFLDGLQHRILVGSSTREWIELKFYRQLQAKKPIAKVGNTIFIYSRVDVESAVNEYLTSSPAP